jgi:hypothetical protein
MYILYLGASTVENLQEVTAGLAQLKPIHIQYEYLLREQG